MREPTDSDDDDTPINADEFFTMLIRRAAQFKPATWMQCTSRRCRRARHCADAAMHCVAQRPPLTPEQDAEVRAQLRAALRAEMAARR